MLGVTGFDGLDRNDAPKGVLKDYLSIIENTMEKTDADVFDGSDIDLSSFDVHGDLCREIWDGEDKLRGEVRDALLDIAGDFIETLGVGEITDGKVSEQDIVSDIQFLGSLASFNYSKYSDIDLHIIVDLSEAGFGDTEMNLFKKYFAQCKDRWNLDHSGLSVLGFEVELYVQDASEKNAANGIYSIMNDEWIKFPEEMDDSSYDAELVKKKALDYIRRIDYLDDLLKTGNEDPEKILDSAEALKDKIVKSRRDSLGGSGDEMSEENLVFKVLRRAEYIDKINDLIYNAYDAGMSMTETDFDS